MVGRWKRRVLSVLAALVVGMTAGLVVSGTAHAGSRFFEREGTRFLASGQLYVSNDVTEWNIDGTFAFSVPRGTCMYHRLDVDRNNKGDKHFYSPTLCRGDGPPESYYNWQGSVTYSRTRGARLSEVWYACCEREILYEEEGPVFP